MENPFFKSKLAYAAPEIVVFEGGGDGPFAGSGDDIDTHTNDSTDNGAR